MPRAKTKGLDIISFTLILSLLFVGWLMVYTVNYDGNAMSLLNFSSTIGKEGLWVGLSVLLILLLQFIDQRIWINLAPVLYIIGIIGLVAVLFVGHEVKGARSWFHLGSFSFQPAEFAKFCTALMLAAVYNTPQASFQNPRIRWMSLFILSIPVVFILLQPDAGSAIIFTSFFIMFYRFGMEPLGAIAVFTFGILLIASLAVPVQYVWAVVLGIASLFVNPFKKQGNYWTVFVLVIISIAAYLIRYVEWSWVFTIPVFLIPLGIQFFRKNFRTGTTVAFVAVLAFIMSFSASYAFNSFLKPHQQDRINVWLNPEKCDPRGSLYNILQSKMAIGSGGVIGKGFRKGTLTKLNYVPEQTTDFIFCTIGEEQGFIGSFATIIIYLLLVGRLIFLAERQRLNFARSYIYSIAGFIFFHFMINIGMTMGLFPVIGIPLPFISYGGTSTLTFALMMGVALKFDSDRYE